MIEGKMRVAEELLISDRLVGEEHRPSEGTRDIIEKFELGLSPRDGEALKNHLTRQGFSIQQLSQGGLIRNDDDGWPQDLFRGRLIIPIRNSRGQLAGFGSRSLDDSGPKYLNSPRSPVFDKGWMLYGLNLAKERIPEEGAVIVEETLVSSDGS